jgi:predicted CXXCH cytochrome family protein
MHNMTRLAATAEVKGPFDGTVFSLKDDSATLETVGGERFVMIKSKQFGDGRWKVTRVIGGHHREDYAGVRVDAPSEERVLPVTYVFATKSLRYKGYSVMVKERPGLRAGTVWSETCIFCHNTAPHLSTVLGALGGRGGYQGEVVDPLLPADKRASYVVKDAAAMSDALEEETARLGARKAHATPTDAVAVTRARFKSEHLVEVGIGCEACHLGSAEHVADPSKRPSFEPRSSFYEMKTKSGTRAEKINRVCARCHQVLFSGYDPTWEGGSRRGRAGGSHINSGEARDMLLGACTSKLSCVECHEPHARDATASLRALDAGGQDKLCTRCHDKYASADAMRAHAHHDPAREGARCISCHMPKKNMSLDGDLSRYHRIGSPTDPERVMLDRPLECALCHADKNVDTLVTTMEKWWNKSYERGGLANLYGSLDANVMRATAERGKPHEQAVAFFVLGQVKDRKAVPILEGQLEHPYPLVRGYAERALEQIK